MRRIKLICALPFISLFIFCVIVATFKQKDKVNVKLLVWRTPSLTIGNHIGISAASGFILSSIAIYTLTLNNRDSLRNKVVRSISNNNIQDDNNILNTNSVNDNTLFHRDVRDPLPTMSVPFRVVGNIDDLDYNDDYSMQDDDSETSESVNEDQSIMAKYPLNNYSPDKDNSNSNLDSNINVENDWFTNSYEYW